MIKKICIDAGHGGKDCGAVNGKNYESIASLSIALKLGALLEKKGYNVVYTRKKDEYLTLAERCNISNKANADAFISIHLNSATNKEATGIETWKYKGCGSTTSKLASSIQENLIKETNAKDRGVKVTSLFYVLKKTKAPAALVECGFISNDSECKKLFDANYQNKLATAICNGIIDK